MTCNVVPYNTSNRPYLDFEDAGLNEELIDSLYQSAMYIPPEEYTNLTQNTQNPISCPKCNASFYTEYSGPSHMLTIKHKYNTIKTFTDIDKLRLKNKYNNIACHTTWNMISLPEGHYPIVNEDGTHKMTFKEKHTHMEEVRVYNKYECIACHTMWHVISLPDSHYPNLNEDGTYTIDMTTCSTLPTKEHIILDMNVPVAAKPLNSDKKRAHQGGNEYAIEKKRKCRSCIIS